MLDALCVDILPLVCGSVQPPCVSPSYVYPVFSNPRLLLFIRSPPGPLSPLHPLTILVHTALYIFVFS